MLCRAVVSRRREAEKGRSPEPVRSMEELGPNLGSASRDWEDLHHFNTFAWEEGEVRMVYEQPSGCLLRFGLNDREGSQVVPDVADAPFGD